MKRFLLYTALFLLLVVVAFFALMCKTGTRTDEFYYRFTTAPQTSLILGTSRASQGVQPSVLNKELGRTDLFNYSFTNDQSPYGAVYLHSVSKKLDHDGKNGVFILCVDPWCLSSDKKNPEDEMLFRENGAMLDGMPFVNLKPNPFYLMRFYDKPYYNILRGITDPQLVLHEDGWLEVDVPMDSASVNTRTVARVAAYRDNVLPSYVISEKRMEYLIKMIEMLADHGKVYIVRLPASSEMLQIEMQLSPDFDDRINKLCSDRNIPYFNMCQTGYNYLYTDGNHLSRLSADDVSRQIADFVKQTANE